MSERYDLIDTEHPEWEKTVGEFIDFYEAGLFAHHWNWLVAVNAVSDERQIKAWIRVGPW